ncbi:MAG: hypothetical protein ACE5EW_02225 [Thermoplasmata archaeon]
MVEHLVLVAVKVGVLILGTSISLLAFLAYRRTGVALMLALSLAFLFIALGTFAEGLLFEVFDWDLSAVHLIESTFILLGLATLAILLRPRGMVPRAPTHLEGEPHKEDGS